MKVGDKVQCWSETEYKCLGWGKIIEIAYLEKDKEAIPLIQLESGKTIWGDQCGWITEKKAFEVGLNVFLKTMGRKFG
jgi:hypothetical protein